MTELVREHDAGVKDGVAVIFVHGLEGDKHSSWTNKASKRSPWPQWLGQEAGCDTWTLSYDASLAAWRDVAGALHINGLSLMDKLATESQLAGRPLVLLCHDIGGLLVKKAILQAMSKAAPRHRRMVGRIAALGLIAVPQSGAQLNTIAQAITMSRGIAANGKDFSTDDTHLQELQREFSQLRDGLNAKVHVYAETKPVVTGKKWLGLFKVRSIAVPYDAQLPHIAGDIVTPLAEDHFSICQPINQSAPLHQSIVAIIAAGKTFTIAASEPLAPQVSAAPVILPSSKAAVTAVLQPQSQPHVVTKAITIRPALIAGPHDERLQASESKLYGRDRELTRVLTFLDNADERAAAVLPRGADVGGAGKTELCKAALKLWVQRDAQHQVFFFALTEETGLAAFLQTVAAGMGLDGADDAETLFAVMPPGLYCLDNLGRFVLDDQGRQLIEKLKSLPGVRLLISSRQALPSGVAQHIEIDALPKQSALNLFRDLWTGSDVLPVDTALAQFVDNDLQRHAMSTALLARLGVFYGYDDMQRRWQALRAESPASQGIQTSLRLVRQALSAKSGALAMWQAVAQTPQGVDAEELLQSEVDGIYPRGTAEFLLHQHIIYKLGNRFAMQAVVAQAGLAGEAEVAAG